MFEEWSQIKVQQWKWKLKENRSIKKSFLLKVWMNGIQFGQNAVDDVMRKLLLFWQLITFIKYKFNFWYLCYIFLVVNSRNRFRRRVSGFVNGNLGFHEFPPRIGHSCKVSQSKDRSDHRHLHHNRGGFVCPQHWSVGKGGQWDSGWSGKILGIGGESKGFGIGDGRWVMCDTDLFCFVTNYTLPCTVLSLVNTKIPKTKIVFIFISNYSLIRSGLE